VPVLGAKLPTALVLAVVLLLLILLQVALGVTMRTGIMKLPLRAALEVKRMMTIAVVIVVIVTMIVILPPLMKMRKRDLGEKSERCNGKRENLREKGRGNNDGKGGNQMEAAMEVLTAPAAPVVALIAPPLVVLGLDVLADRVIMTQLSFLPTL
jgi:hypothetical protein